MRLTKRSPKFNFSNSSVLTVVVTLFVISVFLYFLLSWNKCTESFDGAPAPRPAPSKPAPSRPSPSRPAPAQAPVMTGKVPSYLGSGSSNVKVAPKIQSNITFKNNSSTAVYVRSLDKNGNSNRIKVAIGGSRLLPICSDNKCEIRVHADDVYYNYDKNGKPIVDTRNKPIEHRRFLAEMSSQFIKPNMIITFDKDNTLSVSSPAPAQ